MFSKVDVNGPAANQVWKRLTMALPPANIKWNFEKFLVNHEGVPIRRYPADVSPMRLEKDIRWLLAVSADSRD